MAGHLRRGCRQRAQVSLVQADAAGYGVFNENSIDVDFASFDIFMIAANSTITFLFGDRKA